MTSNLQKCYSGKNVLITGATSVIGVPLLEKLLRDLPQLGNVYLLIRPKDGHSVHWRFAELQNSSAFDRCWEEGSVKRFFEKVTTIQGDISVDNLGIKPEDEDELVQKVDVVFHLAADLDKGDDELRSKLENNVLGTRRVLELCAKMKNLKVFVHVSSAYANVFRESEIEEKVYALHTDVDETVAMIENLDPMDTQQLNTVILGPHVNNYTFTKHMAELEVQKYEHKFPCCIVRPAIITGSWKEPYPGWTNSNKNMMGFFNGCMHGILRRLPARTELVYEYVPVDVVVNHLIVAACHAAVTRTKTVEVSHCTTGSRKPFRWDDVEESLNRCLETYPLKKAVWYPKMKFLPSLTWYLVSAFFVHFVPAVIADLLMIITTRNPMLFEKQWAATKSVLYYRKFIGKEYRFRTDVTERLTDWLSPSDRELFDTSVDDLDWSKYIEALGLGIRRYLNDEPDCDLPEARRKNFKLQILYYLSLVALTVLVWYSFSYLTGLHLSTCSFVVPTFILFLSLI